MDATQTTLTVVAGTGSRFPSANFQLVVWNSSDYANPIDATDREIVRCTSRSGDILTITRGQEGTSGVAHNTGGKTYSVALVVTKAFLDNAPNIPAGTVMVFFQAAAPAGWTQVTTQTDKALRVVSGSGGGSGGTVAMSAGHDHPSAGSHSHTVNSHAHGTPFAVDAGGGKFLFHSTPSFGTGSTFSQNVSATIAGDSATLARMLTDTQAPGTDTQGAHQHGNVTMQYIDVIIAQRD